MTSRWPVAVVALYWTAGCSSGAYPVNYPNNWLTLDGSHIANPEAYYDCLRAGGGTAPISGSSSSRQSMKTDVSLLTACMASKGYRVRNPDEDAVLPYEVATAVSARSRKAWVMEVSWADRLLYWMGTWRADRCESWYRQAVAKPANATYRFRPCSTGTVNEESLGSTAWLAFGSEIFVGGTTEELCKEIVARMNMDSPPPCRKSWIRID